MKGGYHQPEFYPEGSVVKTTPVKCEYPGGQRFDIAVIDQRRVKHYEQGEWKNDRFWGQPLCAAVEIKYIQLGDSFNKGTGGLIEDLKKLSKYEFADSEFCGIAMLFVQVQAQYNEIACINLERVDGISVVRSGIYAAIVGPLDMAWFKVHDRSLCRCAGPGGPSAAIQRST